MSAAVFVLCALTSLASGILLWRAFSATRTRLLLWSSLCFFGLTLNNVLLIFDRLVFPDVSLMLLRSLSALASVCILIYGLVWESQ